MGRARYNGTQVKKIAGQGEYVPPPACAPAAPALVIDAAGPMARAPFATRTARNRPTELWSKTTADPVAGRDRPVSYANSVSEHWPVHGFEINRRNISLRAQALNVAARSYSLSETRRIEPRNNRARPW
jgi:hypothetical protein